MTADKEFQVAEDGLLSPTHAAEPAWQDLMRGCPPLEGHMVHMGAHLQDHMCACPSR